MSSQLLSRLGLNGGWAQEASMAVVTLAIGFGLMPLLIFIAGSGLLGRYDNASSARVYDGVYRGLEVGSLAAWVVVLGPYAIYLLAKLLLMWWRASARLA